MDAKEAVDAERARCVAVVETVMLEAPPEAQSSLTRVRNIIANGAEPLTFRQQVEQAGESPP